MSKKIPYLEVKKQLPFLIPEQYNDAMSYQELLYAVIDVVNEQIEEINKIPSEILKTVNDEFNKLIDDGTFSTIISEQIISDINNRIDANETNISNLNENVSTLNNNFTQFKTKIEPEVSRAQATANSALEKVRYEEVEFTGNSVPALGTSVITGIYVGLSGYIPVSIMPYSVNEYGSGMQYTPVIVSNTQCAIFVKNHNANLAYVARGSVRVMYIKS